MLCAPVFGQMTAEDWLEKGNTLLNESKYNESIEAFDEAIRIDPQFVQALSNKSKALGHQGKYGEAVQTFDKALELNSQYASAWNNKGISLKNLGK